MNKNIVVIETKPYYPNYPYSPHTVYPEFKHVSQNISSDYNPVYEGIRNLLYFLGLDEKNFGKEEWNPFHEFINCGDTVVIKPNWVMDYNPVENDLNSLITHTAVIRPIIDYVLKALNYKGRIIIGDAPLQKCDFDNLLEKSGMKKLLECYKKTYKDVEFIIEDWRITLLSEKKYYKKQFIHSSLDNYILFDLGNESFLEEIAEYSENFRVTCYDPYLMRQHHKKGKHEFLITKRIRDADFFINLPKFKTHIKTGLTGALKNLIGLNGHKEFLPHHIKGSYLEGGDNYLCSSFLKKIYENFDDYIWHNINRKRKIFNIINFQILKILWWLWNLFSKDKIYAGSWSGNETIWRTILDLNHIFYFFDFSSNSFKDIPCRKSITIVDGIIAGEGEGPLLPKSKRLGIIIGGFNPSIIDAVMARIIGYNISRIPLVYNALFNIKSKFCLHKNEKIYIKWCRENKYEFKDLNSIPSYNFLVPKYWRRALSKI
ncbi:MAG: DUF362 domain-containing protein [Candidatus Pacearchaeota archaeon]